MTKKRRAGVIAAGALVMLLGAGLVGSSGYLVWSNQKEDTEAGDFAAKAELAIEKEIRENPMAEYLSNPEFIPDYKLYPEMEMPVKEIDGRFYIGQIEVPSVGISLAVQDEWNYPNLKKTPCRYSGSVYLDNMTIAAHNYRTHFGSLGNAQIGDAVIFTDMDGNVFNYRIARMDEIQPMPDTQVTESGHDLVLFTCTMGGRTRIAVFCDLDYDV